MLNNIYKKAFFFVIILGFFQSGCSKNPLVLKWHKRFKDGFFSGISNEVISSSTPKIEGDELYFGTNGGKLISYDLSRRRVRWKFKSGVSVGSTPKIYKEYVLFGNSEGYFYNLDRRSGKKNWEYSCGGDVLSRAEINPDGIVYFTSANGILTALDLKTGEWLWHYKRPLAQKVSVQGVSSPLLVDKEIIIVGFADGFVCALNPNDGSVVWERKIAKEGRFLDVDAIPVYSDGKIFIPTFEDGLYALNKSGDVLWKYDRGGATSRVLLVDSALYYVSNSGFLSKIDAFTGKEIWSTEFSKGAPTNPLLVGDLIVFGTYSGLLYIFNEKDGTHLWKYILAGQIRGSLFKHLEKIFTITSKGHLFVFAKK